MIADKYVVNVEGVIVKEGHYLLAIRSDKEDHAPGGLAPPGGKVEGTGSAANILETTLRREIAEEVGLEVQDEMVYLESNAFVADDGDPVVDVVFLCRYKAGTAVAATSAEVAGVQWMTADEVRGHPQIAPWTRQSIELAERKRLEKGW